MCEMEGCEGVCVRCEDVYVRCEGCEGMCVRCEGCEGVCEMEDVWTDRILKL